MKPPDLIWLSIFSDLFINLSAGWVGAAIIAPAASKKARVSPWILTTNLLLAIFALILAFKFKKLTSL